MTSRVTTCVLAAGLALGAFSMPSFGQAAGGDNGNPPPPPANNNGGGGGGGGGMGGPGGAGGRWDPAAMQQRLMERLKDQLGATDEEFSAMQPKIEKVMSLSMQANARMGMGALFGRRGGQRNGGGPGGGGPGGRGGMFGMDPNSPVVQAETALQTTLQDPNASADSIKEKLTALRDARAKAKADLTDAQKDLTSLLTQRQEAVLVSDGLLE